VTAAERLSRTAVVVLAVAAGAAIANDYALQPAVGAIAVSMDATTARIAQAVAAAFAGYLAGLVLLVPLADRVSARTLLSAQLTALAGCLALAAASSTPAMLTVALVLVGAATTVAAQSSAIVGRLAPPENRGAQLGTVSAGISAGLLLSRFIGGTLSDLVGWRGALLCLAVLLVACAALVVAVVPRSSPRAPTPYLAALLGLPRLLRQHAMLRRATATGMLWFFSFNLVWVALAVELAEPPFSLSPSAIGLYGLVGALGLVVTRVAGQLADRFGSARVIAASLAVAAASALALTRTLGQPIPTALALATFDAGCFAAQVANQSRVVALDPARSGSLNAAYLTLYYAAGAVGAGIAGAIVTAGGWPAATLTAAVATAGGSLLSRESRR